MNNKIYANWFMHVPGFGIKTMTELLNVYGTLENAYRMSDKDANNLLKKKQAESFIYAKQNSDPDKLYRKLEAEMIDIFPEMDEEFPEKLKKIPNRPFAIYVKGKMPDEHIPSVSIIGARMCSDYGRYMAREFGKELAYSGIQIISGMASGIDGISQRAALSVNGMSFGITGCGVNVCYPEENRDLYEDLIDRGGIISEYVPDTKPKAQYFPLRNRIISGLSDAVIVIEAKKKSGTAITVDMALEQGKEVFALPGRVTDRLSDGCNGLIKQGAYIATCAQDIIEFFGINDNDYGKLSDVIEEGNMISGNEVEKEIMNALNFDRLSIADIQQLLENRSRNFDTKTTMQAIVELCAKGYLIQENGYLRKRFLYRK
ncbi:MAG: DNA-processing protein DprA [Butyrivibrio sp.]|nr:DNA-processing protein DprA [Butyrivibrio sp.]